MTACASGAGSRPVPEPYAALRHELGRDDSSRRASARARLSPTELRADARFAELRAKETAFAPNKPFFAQRDVIASSPLVPLLRAMPKGAALHAHPGALGDLHWLVHAAAITPNVYVYTGPDDDELVHGQTGVFRAPPDARWQLVSELRAKAPDPAAFDRALYESFTLGPEDQGKDPWLEFEKCWARVEAVSDYAPIYRAWYEEDFDAVAQENVQVLELRSWLAGPMDLDHAHAGAERALAEYADIERAVRARHPGFQVKVILSRSRKMPSEKLAVALDEAILLRTRHADRIVGFDLVNEEDRSRPLSDYAPTILAAQRRAEAAGTTLPLMVHAGESNAIANDNLLEALALGAKRIGHGLALPFHPALLERTRRARVPIEACPISNWVLGYVADMRVHPARELIARGLEVTLSPDDAGMMGYPFTWDFYVATVSWGLDLADLKELTSASLRHASLTRDERTAQERAWRSAWDAWIDGLAR
jgi:adenosine deaminase CECR1